MIKLSFIDNSLLEPNEAKRLVSSISDSATMVFPPFLHYKTEILRTCFFSEGDYFEFSIKSIYN